jgi:hypothetical protein
LVFKKLEYVHMPDAAKTRAPLIAVEHAGARFVEGPAGQAFMHSIDDARLVLEACFSNGACSALLYAPNLTPKFFDLSSGEAGAILQKLRNYRIRLAVVHTSDVVSTPDVPRLSSKFREMAEEESRGNYFRLFESAEAARDWLTT